MIQWVYLNEIENLELLSRWKKFLDTNQIDQKLIQKIDLTTKLPTIVDSEGRRLNLDFSNHLNYNKKKGSLKTELISKAMGAGRLGKIILDLSAGLGIDAIFLSQLGYQVTALERNPILYLALETAQNKLSLEEKKNIHFKFASARNFLEEANAVFDVIYFDPMFPEKKKAALPRQEMIIFRSLVGTDDDAAMVLQDAIKSKKAKRIVVKRPLKAPVLVEKPQGQVVGKLIRFDIYGVTL